MLDTRDAVVTIDAMGCQKAIAQEIAERGGHYLLQVKDNQPGLHDVVKGTMLSYVRGHWGIENKLHWSLDMTFREDTLRNRIGHSAENLSRIRRLSLNLLRHEKSCKASLRNKRLRAGLREDCLTQVPGQKI